MAAGQAGAGDGPGRASAEEYAEGHIRGAINVPVTELKKRLHQIPAGQEVVAYCRGLLPVGLRGGQVLRKKGIKARRLEDGYPEWKSAGLPVDDPSRA